MGKKLHQENKQLQSAFPKQGKEVQKFLLKVQNRREVEVRQQVKEVKKQLQSQEVQNRLQYAKEQVKNPLLVKEQLNLQQVGLRQEDQKPHRNQQPGKEVKPQKNRQQKADEKPPKNLLQGKGKKQKLKGKGHDEGLYLILILLIFSSTLFLPRLVLSDHPAFQCCLIP